MALKLLQIAVLVLVCIELLALSTQVCCQDSTETYRDQCRHEVLDLVILFDSAMTNRSTSSQEELNAKQSAMADFTNRFYKSFSISQKKTQLSLMRFFPNGVSFGPLNSSRYGFTEAFIEMDLYGPTYPEGWLAFALHVALNRILLPGHGARGPDVRKVIVIITDGMDDVSLYANRSAVDYAGHLKDVDGVEMFLVTVALYGPVTNLRHIVSMPISSHYLATSFVWQLDDTLNNLLINMNCSGPAGETTAVHYLDECRHEILDLVVLLDPSISEASSSLDQISAKWNFTLDLVVHLHDAFTVSQDLTRFSFMYYTSLVSYVRLNDTSYNFSNNIRNLQTIGPYNVDGSLSSALYVAHNTVLLAGHGSRGPEVRKVLVVVTDGTDDLTRFGNQSAIELAGKLESVDGVEIFVITTANLADPTRLRQIASSPVDSHYLMASDLAPLSRTLDALVINMRCSGPAVQPTTDTYRDQCRHEVLDLVVLFDLAVRKTSTSTQQEASAKWNTTVDFAKRFYESFTISENETHFSLACYYSNTVNSDRLSSYWHDFSAAFTGMYKYGPENADGQLAFALDVAHNTLLLPGQGARGPSVRKVLVIVTDGTDDASLFNYLSVVDYADQLKDEDGAEIFVVTVALNGPDFNLRQIASTPIQSHYLAASFLRQMDDTLNKLLVNMNCSGPAAETSTTADGASNSMRAADSVNILVSSFIVMLLLTLNY